jgi:hypothetical protein
MHHCGIIKLLKQENVYRYTFYIHRLPSYSVIHRRRSYSKLYIGLLHETFSETLRDSKYLFPVSESAIKSVCYYKAQEADITRFVSALESS